MRLTEKNTYIVSYVTNENKSITITVSSEKLFAKIDRMEKRLASGKIVGYCVTSAK